MISIIDNTSCYKYIRWRNDNKKHFPECPAGAFSDLHLDIELKIKRKYTQMDWLIIKLRN
jgi:hypothetical protein